MKVYIANRVAENIELTDKIEIDTSKVGISTLEANEVIIDANKVKVTEEINKSKVENNNIIGYLTIPDILLQKAPIRESTDLTILSQAVGHFTSTNIYEGNVGLASHNSGRQGDYFKNLKNIHVGSKIYYQTSYGTKMYKVVTKEKIDETNLNYLEPTKDNRITLITCVKGERTKRLCVQAVESII